MSMHLSIEKRTGHCTICGDHIGTGIDHSECSKIKQEAYAGAGENKRPTKQLSKKSAASSGRYFSKRYD